MLGNPDKHRGFERLYEVMRYLFTQNISHNGHAPNGYEMGHLPTHFLPDKVMILKFCVPDMCAK